MSGLSHRRHRIHELVLALLIRQGDLELFDEDNPSGSSPADAASWLERNRRVMQRYQAIVRTAVILDSIADQEVEQGGMGAGLRDVPF